YWQTVKTKKLFFYLLVHRDERVSGDCLVDALWHEASRKKGSDSLRKAVQYIRDVSRSMLGKDIELISSAKGSFQLSPGVSVSLDTDEFDAILRIAGNTENAAEKKKLLWKAISLGRKNVATGWYDDWVEQLRRYYNGKCEECLLMIIDLCNRNGEYSEALNACREAVTLNPLEEGYHCRLMETLAGLGRYKEITAHFDKLKKDLKRELGTVPSKETLKVYEALTGTGPGQ
ncbi:MAG: bacterial transcriptional activator domain-containing protein, partial [candidate division WOR-3 bacterium]